MLRTKTAIVVTVLMIGNVAVSLHAATRNLPQEQRRAACDVTIETHIGNLLQERGLERQAATEKAQRLFAGHRPTQFELQHLCDRIGAPLEMNRLEEVLVRRALFGKSVDMTSSESLTGLLHEALGKVPDEVQRQVLNDVAAAYRV